MAGKGRRKTDDFKFLLGLIFACGIGSMVILLNQHATRPTENYHREMICQNKNAKLVSTIYNTAKYDKNIKIITISCKVK